MKKIAVGGSLLLFLAACIWGFAFAAQSVGMEYMGPFTFNGVRFLIGGIVLLPVMLFRERKNCGLSFKKKMEKPPVQSGKRHTALVGGICCGVVICAASTLQQIGIQYTTIGKAGFITTLYIIIVPILGLFLHKKVKGKVWIAAVVASIGLYLLCMGGSGAAGMNDAGIPFGKGDMYIFLCAIIFSVHILVIDYFSPKADGVSLSCIQFFTAGIICTAAALFIEKPVFEQLMAGALPLLYAGVMSCGIAYTLQIIGQKHLEPTVASLILSMESVISVLAGWLILGQALSETELFGCFLVFAAVILVQLPARETAEKKELEELV